MIQMSSRKVWLRSLLALVCLMPIFAFGVVGAQTPIEESCQDLGLPTVSKSRVIGLYEGRSATGAEAQPIALLLANYGTALQSGDVEAMQTVITSDFEEAIGWTECASHSQSNGELQDFQLTPLRVTRDDDGNWLAFIQRSREDGSPEGYRDVFMVITIEQADGSLLIDFAHRDILFDDGTQVDAETMYMDGIAP